jgi:hemerythrin-like domain-containing protein
MIRHGELVLKPIEDIDMSGARPVKDYVASHSETGHHHVLEGNTLVLEREGAPTVVQVEDAGTTLRHDKTQDRHEDVKVPGGMYRLLQKKEYDPIGKVIRKVED